jgi:cystathionine beta-lyase
VIEDQGWHVSPDDAWLVLRGLRTLPLRYGEHGRSALMIARWLDAHPAVDRVLYPPLPGSVGHALWRRDYTGAPGLLGMVLNGADEKQAHRFMQALNLFGMGYSWGGFESLVTHESPQLSHRLHPPVLKGALMRLHIGLEDPDDLIADLDQALGQVCGPDAS